MTKRKPLTEAEWLADTDASSLLHYLRQHQRISKVVGGRRRLRLFACACCRQIWHLITAPRSRDAITISERFADGKASREELAAARQAAQQEARRAENEMRRIIPTLRGPEAQAAQLPWSTATAAEWTAAQGTAVQAAQIVAGWATLAVRSAASGEGEEAANRAWQDLSRRQANLVRDIFGNPFRSPAVDSRWLTWNQGAIGKMAATLYDERHFEEMPILADALEEAGCTDTDILDHCRTQADHARGCWLLDALLGRTPV